MKSLKQTEAKHTRTFEREDGMVVFDAERISLSDPHDAELASAMRALAEGRRLMLQEQRAVTAALRSYRCLVLNGTTGAAAAALAMLRAAVNGKEP